MAAIAIASNGIMAALCGGMAALVAAVQYVSEYSHFFIRSQILIRNEFS